MHRNPLVTEVLQRERELEVTRQAEVMRQLREARKADPEQRQPGFGARACSEETVELRDGGQVVIRPFQKEDRPEVRALFERLSLRSLAQRFHSAGLRITDALLAAVTAGHVLVAEREGVIVALASYRPLPDRDYADAAIVVDDAHQGRGIGLALTRCLSLDAHRAGLHRLRAEVQGSNRAMLRLLRSLNLPMRRALSQGVVEVEIEVGAAARRDARPRCHKTSCP